MTNRRNDVRLLSFDTRVPAPTRRILVARPANRNPTPATEVMEETLRAVSLKFVDGNLHLSQLGTIRRR